MMTDLLTWNDNVIKDHSSFHVASGQCALGLEIGCMESPDSGCRNENIRKVEQTHYRKVLIDTTIAHNNSLVLIRSGMYPLALRFKNATHD